jgi:hypothetical protein
VKLALFALALALAAGCSVSHRSGDFACDTDQRCANGRTCVDGFCVLPADSGVVDGPRPTGDASVCPAQCTSCDIAQRTCAIDCSASNGACNQAISCPAGWNCNVTCSIANQCNAGISCGNATSCTIACTARQTCRNVSCGRGTCKLTCGGTASCGNSVTCGTGACSVACTGGGSCGSAVTCGTGACNVNCTGSAACGGQIDCGSACACDVNCALNAACGAVLCKPGCVGTTPPSPFCVSTGNGCNTCQ